MTAGRAVNVLSPRACIHAAPVLLMGLSGAAGSNQLIVAVLTISFLFLLFSIRLSAVRWVGEQDSRRDCNPPVLLAVSG